MDVYDKQVFLFLVHELTPNLIDLIDLIDSPFFDIYIHVDKKSNLCEFQKQFSNLEYSKIFFISEDDRELVRWGDYSIVKAELKLLKEAKKNNYSFYHLVSGADFILKKPEKIYNFFNEHKNNEFVHFWSIEKENKKIFKERYELYHPLYPPKKTVILKTIYHIKRRFFVATQRLLNVNRLKNKDFELKMGSQWFSITNDFANYVLLKEKWIDEVYSKTLIPDESFMQTLLFNSEVFRKRLYDDNFNDNYKSIKRVIKFVNGVPVIWTASDYKYLIEKDAFMARKFDSVISRKLINMIKQKLNED
ncbi:beta-1,6-N-acetylglucosaminyltransferase [Streptococcus uberis]|uniref:beta-1,6-N-acetylglucosaminyltransferase n=1 Tax=Streptococcus uberis TaxID=1349 RepID=UPI0005443E73|nr:beta-1,6-N-acetylglucosaminyltransferase [Streptococcus uberis]KHD40939.1 hypothetical protein NA32_01480 [Streptococcus hongkongensis]KKF56111.1 hypothetical protein AF67_08295 [Streptococcus uberis 6780]MCR4257302.1 beta-1,6-N-acetylglucosaminyltransferase [Streptococcus uberis]MEE3738994.1 beta-1,6-N-acetylglucosaminyltransferase [Streptococcus uberis]SQG46396.1 exopolysaccharide gene claster protein [Streptococcus uberis]